MISHSFWAVFERKTDIIFFLFFHMLYWVMISSFIRYYFETWILLCFDFWNLLTADLKICLLSHMKLLSILFCLSCLVCCLQLSIFWSVQIECSSCMIFLLTQFVSLSSCCCFHCSLSDCWCLSVQIAFSFFSFSLIHTAHNH